MCTRYYMESSPELRPYVEKAKQSGLAMKMIAGLGRPIIEAGDVRPTDIAPVIAPGSKSHAPTVFPMVWGFTNPGRGGAPIVNCRTETAKSKPFWKDSWSRRRCIIPASYYFEWSSRVHPDGTRQKYLLQPKDSTITFLAGLYRIEERNGLQIPVFTVLTREPGESIRFIHDRMPVILPEEAVQAWIDPERDPEELIRSAITELFFDVHGSC